MKNSEKCFKKGRGTGELLNSGLIFLKDTLLCVYDIWQAKYYELSIPETIEERKSVLSRITDIGEVLARQSSFSRPFSVLGLKSDYFMVGIWEDDVWCRIMTADGEYVNGLSYFEFENLEGFSDMEKGAVHTSSVVGIKPDGTQVVCALRKAAGVSVCSVNDSGLDENWRKMYYLPDISVARNQNLPAVIYSEDNRQTFCDVVANDSCFFLLYSGKIGGQPGSPAYQCQHILSYDWDGAPLIRYELTHSINSFCMDGRMVYGSSSYPSSKIYVYELP